tara:strand:+ start:151 stop:693 length:543 start_codon:yes stop_codon:yes gene_type:complete
MTITTTSKLAYKQINEEGVSGKQKNIIMQAVKDYCNMEHYDGKGISLQEIKTITGIEINAVSGRVNDLKKDKLLETIDKRKCSITNRLVSPVVPKSEESNVFEEEKLKKIELLLRLYGYTNYEFQTRSNGNFGIMIGYYKNIAQKDLVKLQLNSNSKIYQHAFYDDDCGYKFWYEVETKS